MINLTRQLAGIVEENVTASGMNLEAAYVAGYMSQGEVFNLYGSSNGTTLMKSVSFVSSSLLQNLFTLLAFQLSNYGEE